MKFLVDAQIPRRLVKRFRDAGFEAIHTLDLPMGNRTPDSEINALACPQTHLFEDRVMKIDHVSIGKGVYLGPRSAVLYSAKVADHARVGALTLVMKGEYIPAGSSWSGCPAAPARG